MRFVEGDPTFVIPVPSDVGAYTCGRFCGRDLLGWPQAVDPASGRVVLVLPTLNAARPRRNEGFTWPLERSSRAFHTVLVR